MSFQIFIPTIHRTVHEKDVVEALNSVLCEDDDQEVVCKVKIVSKSGRRFAFVSWDKFPENETATRFKTKIELGTQIKLVYNDPFYFMCCKMNEREKPKPTKPFLDMD